MDEVTKIYLDTVLLPQTPDTWHVENSNQNEVIMLASGRHATVPQLDGAQKFKINFEVTNKAYPGLTFADDLKPMRFYTDLLWQIKEDRRAVTITIIRANGHNLCLRALLDDYSYDEKAENASDFEFTTTWTEYTEWHNQQLDVNIEHHLINAKAARGWRDG